MSSIELFKDIFIIDRLDPDGKKFDKVSRIEAHSPNYDMHLLIDVNSEIYPVAANDKFTLALTYTLNLDGTPDNGYYAQDSRSNLAEYEYIMHGKLYEIFEDGSGKSTRAEMHISCGGLLMTLKGDSSYLSQLELDQRLFVLLRKL